MRNKIDKKLNEADAKADSILLKVIRSRFSAVIIIAVVAGAFIIGRLSVACGG